MKRAPLNMVGGEVEREGEGGGTWERRGRRGRRALPANQGWKYSRLGKGFED